MVGHQPYFFKHQIADVVNQQWPTSQRPSATFLTVLRQRATSYTLTHMNITPLFLTHTNLLLSWIQCKYSITYQYDNDRTLKAIYCYACYIVGLLVIK